MKPTASQYAHALIELSHEGSDSAQAEVAARFVALLRRRRETRKLPAILRHLERLTDAAAGVQRARVTTAEPLSDAALATLTEQLAPLLAPRNSVLGQATEHFIIDQHLDPSVLGGVSIRTETELFDTTVRRQLRELQKALTQ